MGTNPNWSAQVRRKFLLMNKPQFNKGDLIEVTENLAGASGDTPKGIMGFVIGLRAFQKSPYNQTWYDVHLADGRTLTMLSTGLEKVNND